MSFPRLPLFPSSWRLFALAQIILVLMLFAAFGSTFSVVTAPIHRRRGGALFSTAPAESESGTAVAATPAEGQYMEPDVSHSPITQGTGEFTERIVQSQWEKQRRWARVYKGRRTQLETVRVAKLSCISVGAVLQVAATQVPVGWKTTTTLAGGGLTALGGYIKNKMVRPEDVSQTVTSFYVAQALKSEVYKFRTRAFPYNKSDRLEKLRKNCNEISSANGHDRRFHVMKKDKKPIPPPMPTRREYFEKRLDPRIESFLRGKARKMEARGKFCSRVEDAFITAGAGIGFLSAQKLPAKLAAYVEGLTGWAAAFTVVSAAFANHHAKMKFEEIADDYFDTADQLEKIKDNWPMNCNKAGDPGWDEQIAICEELILSTTEEFAKKRTGNKELTFVKPKRRTSVRTWNPEVICGNDETGGYTAKDRALWLVENKKLGMKEAQQKVMEEFPDNF